MELDSGCCTWLCPKILIRRDILANYSDLFPPSSHLKWWFRIRVIPPHYAVNSGLGIMWNYTNLSGEMHGVI